MNDFVQARDLRRVHARHRENGPAATLTLEPPPNATVVETFRLYYAGLVGSPDFVRTVEAGERVLVTETLDCGLHRVITDPSSGRRGALVDAEKIRLDDASPSGAASTVAS